MFKRLNMKKDTSLVRNINLDLNNKNQRKVLISYLSLPLKIELENQEIYHTNIFEVLELINVFIKLGFSVDILNNDDIEAIKIIDAEKYDIILGFGKVFEQLSKITNKAIKIIYVTENEPKLSEKKEIERIIYFYERKKKKVKIERSGKYYTEKSFDNVNYALIMSDIKNFHKYNLKKYDICPTGFINKKFVNIEKKYNHSKKNFIWLGSRGAIHKGLDIVVDIFKKNKDIHLYICGLTSGDRKILKIKDSENIKDIGKININSDEFLQLVNKCSFMIQPSCSEACSTAVLTGIRHGLIPIIIKDSGMDKISNYCITSSSYKVEDLEEIIKKSINLDNNWIKEKQFYNFEEGNKYFCLEYFINTIKKHIEDILGKENE